MTNNLYKVTRKSDTPEIATDILQVTFNGFNGFRWPIAYFPTTKANPAQLWNIFWEGVDIMDQYGFEVLYCSLDGASTNRSFMHMHFDRSIKESLFTTRNIYNSSQPMFLIQDIKHVLKKIRNSVSASSTNSKVRCLVLNDLPILWDYWVQAYHYNSSFVLRIHPKLTKEHVYLTNASKMRNKLANQVLDSDMLRLMKAYQQSLPEVRRSSLNSAISFLQKTSTLVDIFHDCKRPVVDIHDSRLVTIGEVLNFFQTWERDIMAKSDNAKNKKAQLMTAETREDLESSLIGFDQMCRYVVSRGIAVIPGLINSDPVENLFCQQRGINHGLSTNPTVSQYGPGINSIILGQNTVSKRSNSGNETAKFKGYNPSKKLKVNRL